MASIDKRNGQYRVRWRDPDGSARSRQCPTLAAARKLTREIEDAVALGRRWEPEGAHGVPRLEDLIAGFLADCFRTKAATSIKCYRSRLVQFQEWASATLRRAPLVTDLSRKLLNDYWAHLGTERRLHIGGGKTRRTRPCTSREQIIQTIFAAWKWAYFDEDHREMVPRPPRKMDYRPAPGRITIAPMTTEVDAMLGQLDGQWYRIGVLLRFTGLRISQVLGLRWEDIWFDRAMLHLRGELGKSRQERTGRVVPVSPHLLQEMAGWGAREGQIFEPAPTPDQVRVQFEEAWKAAKVPERVWAQRKCHALRKWFVTELRRQGAEADAVEYLVGHSLGLRGVYTDPEALETRRAVGLLPPIGGCVPAVSQLAKRNAEG